MKDIFAMTIFSPSLGIYSHHFISITPENCAVCTESVYLAGLSNQMGALPTFVLNGVDNILHRELEAMVLDLDLVAAFFSSSLFCVFGSADHIDQELKPNAL